MAFFPISSFGSGSEKVELGVEYNANNLRVNGLFFQGNYSRDLFFTVRYFLDDGNDEWNTLGPLNAKNQVTGNILNLTGLNQFMREVPVFFQPPGEGPDGEGKPDLIDTGDTQILLPSILIGFSVTWGGGGD